jgi:DegV family protein with EDD domain
MIPNHIAIITDSTCDIPQDLIEKHQIQIVPQYVIWGEEQFKDRLELEPAAFYKRLEEDPRLPTSAHATIMDFTQAYQEAKQSGAEQILVFTVSGAMSGAFHAAQMAAETMDIPVIPIDSRGPTMSLGWQVLTAARLREETTNTQEILNAVQAVRTKLVNLVAMDTVKYLQTGGRIGDAAKLVGNMLQIKPLVKINHVSGKVEPVTVTRTYKSLIATLYKRFFDQIDSEKKLHLAILHGNTPQEAETLKNQILEVYTPVELIINITGPVLGINTGPKAMALVGYTED